MHWEMGRQFGIFTRHGTRKTTVQYVTRCKARRLRAKLWVLGSNEHPAERTAFLSPTHGSHSTLPIARPSSYQFFIRVAWHLEIC